MNQYFLAVSRLDQEAYLNCFAETAAVQDPYGGKPLQGHEALTKFMETMKKTWSTLSMVGHETYIVADRAAVHWRAQGTSHGGKTAEFSGNNVFTFGEDGRIVRLNAYWDFKAMVDQIS